MSTHGKAKSQASFEQICTLLDFSKGNGLVTDVKSVEDDYTKQILADALRKLNIDAIYFFRPHEGGPSIPLIYFKLMEYPTPSAIAEIHKLSWNMGQAPLLFIVLPDTVQIYNNLKPPVSGDERAGFIEELKVFSEAEKEREALKKYERAELETGDYWRRNIDIFKTDTSIFRMLLNNLDYMRRKLIGAGLPSKIVHSILVRSIFVKYLEGRHDSHGQSVFPRGFFSQYGSNASCFTDLLRTKEGTYRFFRDLDAKFNGDIFVVEQDEENTISQDHLNLLQKMLEGKEYMDTRQMVLWPSYSFDVIPIELVSSIYEQFFALENEKGEAHVKGAYFTPYRLVALLMDEILPLSTKDINMRMIDPTCGSGIFLVEGYRRLVARWKKANDYENPSSQELLEILKNSIFGVDLDEKAIRICALSLYLTLCDYLEPKAIWNDIKFEKLVGSNLFVADSLRNIPKLQGKFDLVVGNPPWESRLSISAQSYVRSHRLQIGDRQICQVFLWRATELCKPEGNVCMIVSSKALLFNRSTTNSEFRESFFSKHEIKMIYNFSTLRHSLFLHAVGPATAIVFSPSIPPENEVIVYCSPKPSFTLQDELSFIIEPQDIAHIPIEEALKFEEIWKIAMWGSPRDLELIRKLSLNHSLNDVAKDRHWVHGEGYWVGNRKHFTKDLLGKPEVLAEKLQRYIVESKSLEPCSKDHFERLRKGKQQKIYSGPHLLIKASPRKGYGLISAVMTTDSVFSGSIVGIHGEEKSLSDLIAVCQAINTDLTLYYLMLTSSRWLVERDELTESEIMSIPIPKGILGDNFDMKLLEKLATDNEFRQIENEKLMNLYGLDKTEKTLVADTIRFTLGYFLDKKDSEAIKPAAETDVKTYLTTLCQTLNRQFSPSEQSFVGTVYSTRGPLRLISIQLAPKSEKTVTEEPSAEEMEKILTQLDKDLLEKRAASIYVRRHLRSYSENYSVHIIKPNQMRYWTKSSAISDAGQIYADIMESPRRD